MSAEMIAEHIRTSLELPSLIVQGYLEDLQDHALRGLRGGGGAGQRQERTDRGRSHHCFLLRSRVPRSGAGSAALRTLDPLLDLPNRLEVLVKFHLVLCAKASLERL